MKQPKRLKRPEDPNDDASFNRLFRRIVIILVVITLGLFATIFTSGPRLRQAEINIGQAVATPNQRLILRANQPLAKLRLDQISIKPAIQFSATNSANTIVITFKQRLQYNTEYTVTVRDVVALYDNQAIIGDNKAQFEHRFTTNDPTAYYLKRAGQFSRQADAPDKIMQTALTADDSSEFFSSRRIQDFVVLDDKLVVVTSQDSGLNEVFFVNAQNGQPTTVSLPAAGRVDQLQASNDGLTYGFRFSADSASAQNRPVQDNQNTLYIHNTSPGRLMTPLDGIGGKPLQVLDWQFAPDGTSVAARTYDMNVLLLDTSFTRTPLVFGMFTAAGSFSSDSIKLSVRNQEGFATLNLVDRKLTKLDPNKLHIDGTPAIPIDVQLLSNQPGELARVQTTSNQGRTLVDSILITRPQGQKVIRRYDASQRLLVAYRTTPNDQYVIAEESAPPANATGLAYDGYPGAVKPLQTQTVLIDSATGAVIKKFDGINLRW